MLYFIHNDPEFKELLSIVSNRKGIDIRLIEKDYWIMHALYSLQKQGIEFELKGGTSTFTFVQILAYPSKGKKTNRK